jgi:hypothetical protein
MNWTEIRQQLKAAPNEVLLDMIKGLYGLSAENKAYLRTTLSPARQDSELLEKSRRQVIRAIYPENTQNPHMPHFGESRQVIRAYQKATGDVSGTLDLMLTHVERGTDFTCAFGDIDEPFYKALETMLANATQLLLKSPEAPRLYETFSPRFENLSRKASKIGWGYGDSVDQMVDELREKFEE